MRILGLGGVEWIIIGVVVILIFGTGKIAGFGPALGKSIRGFRSAMKGEDEEKPKETTQATQATQAPPAATVKSDTNKES